MKTLIFSLLLFTLSIVTYAQKVITNDSNYVFWDQNRPLLVTDFKIKTGNSASTSFGQFTMDYNIGSAFTLSLPKNYKEKIRNYLIKSASSIDTTAQLNTTIKYQQTLFDMAEIYTRKFRKSIYENRKKIIWGKIVVDELNAEAMTAFANRRFRYELETISGTEVIKQKEWEMMLKKELMELESFSAKVTNY